MKENQGNYKITIYLGKELHEKLKSISEALGIPLATTTKLILKTGMELSQIIEFNIRK